MISDSYRCVRVLGCVGAGQAPSTNRPPPPLPQLIYVCVCLVLYKIFRTGTAFTVWTLFHSFHFLLHMFNYRLKILCPTSSLRPWQSIRQWPVHVMTCPGQVEIVVPGTWDQNLFIDDDSPVGDSFSSVQISFNGHFYILSYIILCIFVWSSVNVCSDLFSLVTHLVTFKKCKEGEGHSLCHFEHWLLCSVNCLM